MMRGCRRETERMRRAETPRRISARTAGAVETPEAVPRRRRAVKSSPSSATRITRLADMLTQLIKRDL